jgi:hypothetical protein
MSIRRVARPTARLIDLRSSRTFIPTWKDSQSAPKLQGLMSQTAFYPQFNKFCLEWATPIPGSVTTYGGPLRSNEPAFRAQLNLHKEALFEQLLLFDSVHFNITGPNLICPLIYQFMGPKTFEELLEQSAISFVVWQPVPMLSHKDGKVAATFTGSIGDGKGSEFDIERIVDGGLRMHPGNMWTSYRRQLIQKLVKAHRLLDRELSASAWRLAEDALKTGELSDLGLPARPTSIGLPAREGELLLNAAESLLYYRYVMSSGMVSQNNAGVFDLFQLGLRNLQERRSPVEKYAVIAQFEGFPNLRSLMSEMESPFKRIVRFRQTHTATKFREWLSAASDSDIGLVREYVNACTKRKRLFESAPAKFVKVASMIALAHAAGAEAVAAGALLMTSIPPEVVSEALKLSAEFGTGVIDSFLIENLKVGWTPRAYFDGLRRLRR